jgi:hypothetical protein
MNEAQGEYYGEGVPTRMMCASQDLAVMVGTMQRELMLQRKQLDELIDYCYQPQPKCRCKRSEE